MVMIKFLISVILISLCNSISLSNLFRYGGVFPDGLKESFEITEEPMDNYETLTDLMLTSHEAVYKFYDQNSNNCESRKDFTGPDYFKFFPAFKGRVRAPGDFIEFSNNCFDQNRFTFASESKDSVTFEISVGKPSSYLCKDSYLLSTATIHRAVFIFFKGKKSITISKLTPNDIVEIHVNGLRLYGFCDNLYTTLMSMYRTVKLLNPEKEDHSDKRDEETEKDHIGFLKRFANMTIEDRGKYQDVVFPLENEIHSGDFLGLSQIAGGESVFIMYAGGGRISHSAMALRYQDELYVVESEDLGVIMTKYRPWIERHVKAQYEIAHFPLKEEYRKKFDSQKAYEFIKPKLGLEYGMKNFLFPGIDVLKDCVAEYFSHEAIFLLISLFEKYDRSLSDTLLIEGINLRLGTKNLTVREVVAEAAKRNMTIEEVTVMPEQDKWMYSNGDNWVCSALVVGLYQAAGIFGNLEIQAKEFMPKDIYQMAIFDKSYKERRPQFCKDADPELDYCMIIGKYRIKVDHYSTIPLYAHMNERCPNVPPKYERPENC